MSILMIQLNIRKKKSCKIRISRIHDDNNFCNDPLLERLRANGSCCTEQRRVPLDVREVIRSLRFLD